MVDSNKPDPAKDDPFMASISRLQKQNGAFVHETKKKHDQSFANRLGTDVGRITKFFNAVAQGSDAVYQRVLRPLWNRVAWPVTRATTNAFVNGFVGFTHPKDKYGERHLSVGRASIAVTAAAAAILGSAVYGPHLAWEGTKDVAWSATSGLWYAGTHEHVKMVMTSSRMHETDDLKGVAEGCTAMPCTQTNSWHFVIDDSGFHQLHSLFTGNGVFDPRRVVSAVADTYNICEEDIYGAPHKLLYKWGLMNPRLIGVTACYPMEPRSDPAYIEYVNKILESNDSLADSIRTTHMPGSTTIPALSTVAPTIAPAGP